MYVSEKAKEIIGLGLRRLLIEIWGLVAARVIICLEVAKGALVKEVIKIA